MIGSSPLDFLNDALIKTTNKNSIMSGIKTIFFVGDIAQVLPPPDKKKKPTKPESMIWESAIYNNNVNKYDLIRPVRQKDGAFITILNKVRLGLYDEDVVKFINQRAVYKKDLPINCLRLYTTNLRVQHANQHDFDTIPGEEVRIVAEGSYVGAVGTARRALAETRLSQELVLKIGMPVMLIQNMNISLGWVNGTIATVFEIDDNNIGLKKYDTDDVDHEEPLLYWIQRITRQIAGTSYARPQSPIVPAFASTIHKCQSATIDCIAIYLDNMLTHGQLYVAMSRVKKKGIRPILFWRCVAFEYYKKVWSGRRCHLHC